MRKVYPLWKGTLYHLYDHLLQGEGHQRLHSLQQLTASLPIMHLQSKEKHKKSVKYKQQSFLLQTELYSRDNNVVVHVVHHLHQQMVRKYSSSYNNNTNQDMQRVSSILFCKSAQKSMLSYRIWSFAFHRMSIHRIAGLLLENILWQKKSFLTLKPNKIQSAGMLLGRLAKLFILCAHKLDLN